MSVQYYSEVAIESLLSLIDSMRAQRALVMVECSTPGLHIEHDPKQPEFGDLDKHGKCRTMAQIDRAIWSYIKHLDTLCI